MSSSTKPPLPSDPQDSSQPSPPAGESPPEYPSPSPPVQSPPPAQKPPMASPPLYSPPPPEPIVSPPPSITPPPPSITPPPPASSPPIWPPPPSIPTPESPPPPVDPPASSPPPPLYPSPPPPTSNDHPPPPPLSNNNPPPPATNLPTPPPNSSPPPEPLVSSPPSWSPPPPKNSPPPPLPHSRPSPLAPQAPSLLKSPPPHSSWSVPSYSSTNSSSRHAPKVSDYSSFGDFGPWATSSVMVGVIAILGFCIYCCVRTRKKASGRNSAYIMPTSSHESDPAFLKFQMSKSKNRSGSSSGLDIICSPSEHGGFSNSRSWFNYDELAQATNGFSAQNLLGEGGFGSVYKGRLANGRDVAVKQLKIGGGQGDREFRSEVEIINRIHHRHLVSLVGYCIIEHRRLLVYEYVPNNNLYFHLHGEGVPVLNWALRVKIALGAARGIAYLHEDCHPRIIHRDIKSSNILLDSNFDARVSDFGLAKLALDANSHVTTRVMGTFGYMAPEYASSGKLTERSDVYSFGVVLLELITGRKPVDKSRPLGAESLVESARPLLSQALETEDFERLVDPRLERQYVVSEMFRMIEAAAACVRHSFIKRPKMGQVVRALDTMASTDLTNGMRVGESEMFSPSSQSAEIRLFQRMAFGNPDEMSTGFFDG